MATTGKVQGRLFKIVIDGTAIEDQIDGTIDLTRDMDEATTKDSASTAKEFLPSYLSGTCSASGYLDFGQSEGGVAGFDDIVAGTAIVVEFTTEVSGDTGFSASGYVTSWSLSAPLQGVSEWSMSYQLTGAITKTTEPT